MGAICLLAAGGAYLQGRAYQARQERALARALARPDPAAATGALSPAAAPTSEDEELDPSLVGRLDVPRLDLSVMVKEGDDARTLKVAAGHVPGTAMPWERGNVGIAGHRDTFFRKLKDVRKGDEILVTTRRGRFAYHVEKLSVVRPDEVSVLDPAKSGRLTLITCYPFSWAGPAPKRFIVSATKQ